LFHFLIEFFSIIIAFGVFLLAWNSRRFIKSDYYLLLGVAYLFVAAIDLLHALAYKGMGVFLNDGANLPTQLWIIARYLESMTLLIAPVFISRHFQSVFKSFFHIYLIIIYFSIFTVVLFTIFWLNIFPTCYVEGVGLTDFKIVSEYVISIILSGALLYTYQHRALLEPQMFQWLIQSIAFSIAAEMVFTLYMDVYGLMNLSGHYFKLISYYLIYKAMIETTLLRPYETLFRDLQTSEKRFRSYFQQPLIGIAIFADDWRWLEVNNKFCELLGYTRADLEKQTWETVTYRDDWSVEKTELENVITGYSDGYSCEKRFIRGDNVIIDASVSLKSVWEHGKLDYIIAIVADITDRKQAERDRENLINELKEALSDIKILQGLLPICPTCGKVKDDNGYWRRVEDYVCQHSDVEFRYTICDNCLQKKYPEAYEIKKTALQYRAHLSDTSKQQDNKLN
jgi:PAS domain S-box-containing protein